VISTEEAIAYSLTGPLARASGVNYDVRKAFPYSGYERFDFDVPLGTKGDNYDRFLVRFNEITESLRIIEQGLRDLPDGPVNIDDPHIIMRPKDEVYGSIEAMCIFQLRGAMVSSGSTSFQMEPAHRTAFVFAPRALWRWGSLARCLRDTWWRMWCRSSA
jgi:NADH:ubiquinone oxidoreductase subunit D